MRHQSHFKPMSKEEADFYGVSFEKEDNASARALEVRNKEKEKVIHMKRQNIKQEMDFYGLRIRNMQPAMVGFNTQDSLERSLMAELENFNPSSDDYFYDENGNEQPMQRELELEAEAANLSKQSIEQVLASSTKQEQKPVNKGLLVGGAALAAYLLFGGN